ncbi:MAG TPA: DegQ family serine endoprotease [Verrucomicrobiae bacterium]|nr:DegQ family serine endoprotease [Verrucomicrobiae bacterium]
MNGRKLQTPGLIMATTLSLAVGLTALLAAEPAPPVPIGDTAALRALGGAFSEIADRVGPSVVTVYSGKSVRFQRPDFSFPFGDGSPFQWFFGNPDEPPQQPRSPREREYRFFQEGTGSGIIVDKQGRILTNYHVVKDVDEIKIALSDKRIFDGEVVGTDPRTDLAVIKIKGDVPHDLTVAVLGDSDKARVGDWVVAIGAPFGYVQTVTHGIISAKGRDGIGQGDDYEDFIQTDAPINPGNSGGPLVNLQGEVVGINAAIRSTIGQFSGVGFAIPINMAREILPTLLQGGKVTRGFLGLLIQDVDEDSVQTFHLPDSQGALVKQVNGGTPAAQAGIQPGDVVISYRGKKIEDANHLRNLVASTAPGTKVDLVVLRDGHERSLSATIGQLKTDAGSEPNARQEGQESANPSASLLGLTVEPLTPRNAKQYNLDENDKGVVVTEVDQDSPAARTDLHPGDLITAIERTPVSSVAEFRDAMANATNKRRILLNIKRQGNRHFVILHPKDQQPTE